MKFLDKENTTEILFCDNHLLVVNKPAGILTQPNETESKSLEEMAKKWVRETYEKPGNVFLHCVHRIDKPVSGIVVFARTSKALSRMNEQIRDRKIERSYLAIVQGALKKKQGKLEHFLKHSSHRAKVVRAGSEGAKKAILTYEVVESWSGFSLVKIQLETGRYHQIRAQFSSIGHPILGDEKYGESMHLPNRAICLHQFHISFEHPTLKEKVNIYANWTLAKSLKFIGASVQKKLSVLLSKYG